MKKIHIGGAQYGLHNIGDEAILLSIINSFDEFDLSVTSHGSNWINKLNKRIEIRNYFVDYGKPKFGLFINPKRDIFNNICKLKDDIDFFKTKNIYVCGGGTILSDCPWYSLRTVQLAGSVGVPVYLWGVGMAEVNDKSTQHYIKSVLNKGYVKYIYTRDEFVKSRLVDIGVKEAKISVSYDPAILIKGDLNWNTYLSKSQIELYNDNHINMVFSLSGESDVVIRTPVKEIAESIIKLQKKYSANIFLIPTGCGNHCKDIELLEYIYRIANNKRVCIIKKEFSPESLVGFLENIQIIVSSRLHLNIFGACAGIPSIGLVRNSKIIDFSKLLGMPYLRIEELKAEEIILTVDEILKNRTFYTSNVVCSVRKMRKAYIDSLEDIKMKISRE